MKKYISLKFSDSTICFLLIIIYIVKEVWYRFPQSNSGEKTLNVEQDNWGKIYNNINKWKIMLNRPKFRMKFLDHKINIFIILLYFKKSKFICCGINWNFLPIALLFNVSQQIIQISISNPNVNYNAYLGHYFKKLFNFNILRSSIILGFILKF